MEKKPVIGLGIDSFSELINEGCYYVDKTDLIQNLLESKKKVTLFTRPRRFGKSLALSMFAEFFDITKKKENAHLFDGLKISQYTELCKKHQNAYPVISLSFKDAHSDEPEEALQELRDVVAELYQDAAETILPDIKDDVQKDLFTHIKSGTSNTNELTKSLKFLTRLLHRHYGLPVILLLDEYDVPLQKAFIKGFYKKILTPVQKMISAAFKGNPHLKFGIITGCLRIAKESIFTGMNNLMVNTVLTEGQNEYFGFTPAETEKLLIDSGLANEICTVQEWYDGYRFGDNEVYNPWSVLSFANQGICKPQSAAIPYWMNTSGNDILKLLFRIYNKNTRIRVDLENLLNGASIFKPITENSTFGNFSKTPDSIWSLLLLTGYLKPVSSPQTIKGRDYYKMVLPNKEVHKIVLGRFDEWFSAKVDNFPHKKLAELFFTGHTQAAADKITKILRRTISVRDSIEIFYGGILTGLLTPLDDSCNCEVKSSPETGDGYSDIVVKDNKRKIRVTIELKKAESPKCQPTISADEWDIAIEKQFKAALDKAENQIRNRRYSNKDFQEKDQIQLAYAAAFLGKECRLRKIEF